MVYDRRTSRRTQIQRYVSEPGSGGPGARPIHPSDAVTVHRDEPGRPAVRRRERADARSTSRWDEEEGTASSGADRCSASYAGHVFVDSLQGNLLLDYDPYATPNGPRGHREPQRRPCALSKYDAETGTVCATTRSATASWRSTSTTGPGPEGRPRSTPRTSQPIGIIARHQGASDDHDVRQVQRLAGPGADLPERRLDPGLPRRLHVRAAVVRFGKPRTRGAATTRRLGATADQMTEWGYSITSRPERRRQARRSAPPIPVGDERDAMLGRLRHVPDGRGRAVGAADVHQHERDHRRRTS